MEMPSACNIAVIGISTGGPRMYRPLFSGMPVLDGCIIFVQHMPAFINANIIAMISSFTRMRTKAAEHRERLQKGMIYVAPSGTHLTLARNREILLSQGPRVNFCCPSVDVAMLSLAPDPDVVLAGAVLTGMGSDGARGIAHIKRLGGVTMAQDEHTSIIFGMPKAAIETRLVDFILPPTQIQAKLIELFGKLQ